MRDQLSVALKDAMKAQDATRTGTLRLVLAAIKEREISQRDADGGEKLDDNSVLEILSKMIRQREDSAQVYEESGRLELAERERAEIEVIREFLPTPLSEAEIAAAIETTIGELKATSIKDIGKVMGALKERYPGRMDFSKTGAIVKRALA